MNRKVAYYLEERIRAHISSMPTRHFYGYFRIVGTSSLFSMVYLLSVELTHNVEHAEQASS